MCGCYATLEGLAQRLVHGRHRQPGPGACKLYTGKGSCHTALVWHGLCVLCRFAVTKSFSALRQSRPSLRVTRSISSRAGADVNRDFGESVAPPSGRAHTASICLQAAGCEANLVHLACPGSPHLALSAWAPAGAYSFLGCRENRFFDNMLEPMSQVLERCEMPAWGCHVSAHIIQPSGAFVCVPIGATWVALQLP
jgi:hypothetical protein